MAKIKNKFNVLLTGFLAAIFGNNLVAQESDSGSATNDDSVAQEAAQGSLSAGAIAAAVAAAAAIAAAADSGGGGAAAPAPTPAPTLGPQPIAIAYTSAYTSANYNN